MMERHLHIVPAADPLDAVVHLSKIRANAAQTFGEDSPVTRELNAKLADANRAMLRKYAPEGLRK